MQQVFEKGILQLIIYYIHLNVLYIILLCQGRMLFCAFVDYSKAFDSVNRLRLWTQYGKLFRVVQNICKPHA